MTPRVGPCTIDLPYNGIFMAIYVQEKVLWQSKWPNYQKKKNTNVYFCIAYSRYFSTSIHRVNSRKKLFNLSCIRVQIYHHIFNNLSELHNGDPASKTRQGTLSHDLMDRYCNCFIILKVNINCIYKDKFHKRCLIYKLKFSLCDTIYIGNI